MALSATVSDDLKVVIGLAAGEPTEVIAATGIGANVKDRVPAVMFRRKAKDTAYVWYLSLSGKPAQLKQLPVMDESGRKLDTSTAAAVAVTEPDGTRRILIANPDKRAVLVSPPEGPQLRTSAAFAVR